MPKTRLISPGSIPNHRLLKNLQLQGNYISNDGGDEGLSIDNDGIVTASSQIDIGNMSLTTSELDLSSGSLTIDVDEDIILDIGATDELLIKEDGSTFAKIFESSGGNLRLYESAGGTDSFSIITGAHGATTIGTTDVAGNEADITIAADGYLQFTTRGYSGAVGAGEDLLIQPGGKIHIDKNWSHTTAYGLTALHVDVDRTGDVTTGTDTAIGIDLDVNHTGASGGNISVSGLDIDVTTDTGGDTNTIIGLSVDVTGGDLTYGFILNSPDGGVDFLNQSSADTSDHFKIQTIEDGETTLTTTENGGGSTAHLNMVADGDFTVDAEGDISLDAQGGIIALLDGGSTYSPTASSDAVTKRYTDLYINCPSMPFFFNETTASRTYFRNADDTFNQWEWDSYDTEDSTSVDATINLAASNLLAGYIVGFGCTLVGATWNTYQANAVSGVAAFQIWTSDPSDSSVATLRTTDTITANRAHTTTSTSAIDIGLNAGDVVIPAIQYISGTATIWYGGVTLLFTR